MISVTSYYYRVLDNKAKGSPIESKNIFEGNKAIFPSSLLTQVSIEKAKYPLIFSLSVLNEADTKPRTIYCGVIEFTAPEGTCYLPDSIQKTLSLKKTDKDEIVKVKLATISNCNSIVLKPFRNNLFTVDNASLFLENKLNNFICLGKGDILIFEGEHDDLIEIEVHSVSPKSVGKIIKGDLKVEFETSYEEDFKEKQVEEKIIVQVEEDGFVCHYEESAYGERKLIKKVKKESGEGSVHSLK